MSSSGGANQAAGYRNFLSDIKSMIRYGIPSEMGQYFSNFTSQNFVTIVLGVFTSNATVGYFQAATGVTAIISIIATSLALSLFAGFSSLHGQNKDTGLAFVYAVKYVAYVGAPFVFFLIAASGPIIRVVFGTGYISAAPLLALISFSNIPMIIGQSVFIPYFNGIGKTRFTMYALIADGLAAIILAPILGMYYGAYGVTFALLGSNLASGIVALYLARKYLNTRIDYRSSFLALCASIICAGVAYASGFLNSSSSLIPNLIILVIEFAVFFGLYLLLAPLFSVVRKDDIVRLSAATRGMAIFSKLFQDLVTD